MTKRKRVVVKNPSGTLKKVANTDQFCVDLWQCSVETRHIPRSGLATEHLKIKPLMFLTAIVLCAFQKIGSGLSPFVQTSKEIGTSAPPCILVKRSLKIIYLEHFGR